MVPQPERDPPSIPMDYNWAQELGLIRKPASVMSSICDERGQELLYAGMPISDVFKVKIPWEKGEGEGGLAKGYVKDTLGGKMQRFFFLG